MNMEEQSNQLAAADRGAKIRCAVYTRYSSDLQRPASSEDQIRNCCAGAREKGWTVLEEFIRSDEEQSGRTMVGREGLI